MDYLMEKYMGMALCIATGCKDVQPTHWTQ